MHHYRESFPKASILPKMHILEDHVVPWIEKWRVGAGLMGEQGAESIHAHIGRLEDQYRGIANALERLKYIITEHNLESSPLLNSLEPEPKKRKRSSQ